MWGLHPPSKTTATLIRRQPLTESSLILHWCSEEHGLLKSVAKGARRPKSPFAGKLDLFYRCEIELVPARRGELHLLKEAAVRSSRLGIRSSYARTLAASYFIKLLERVAETESPIADLAGLLDRALDFLAENPPDPRAVRHYEKQMALMLGIAAPDREPCECIRENFGSLPRQREELLKLLSRP